MAKDIRDGKWGVSSLRGHSGARESIGLAGEVSGKIIELAWEEDSDVAGGGGGLPSKGGVPKQNNAGKKARGNYGASKRCPKLGWGKPIVSMDGPRTGRWCKGNWKKKAWERLILLRGGDIELNPGPERDMLDPTRERENEPFDDPAGCA